MDRWAWEQLDPWLEIRRELPIGALLCVIHGPTAGRRWEASAARKQLHPRPRELASGVVRAAPAPARSRGRDGARRRAAGRDPAPARARQPRHHQRLPAGHRQQRDHQHRPRTAIADDLRQRRPAVEAIEAMRPGRPAPAGRPGAAPPAGEWRAAGGAARPLDPPWVERRAGQAPGAAGAMQSRESKSLCHRRGRGAADRATQGSRPHV